MSDGCEYDKTLATMKPLESETSKANITINIIIKYQYD
jgi:hypothetical protein